VSIRLRLIHWIANRLQCRNIYAEDGALYLQRFRVFGWTEGSRWFGPSLYLHRFRLPDQDAALHNHPWRWGFSWILSGGYIEDRGHQSGFALIRDGRFCRLPGDLNVIRPETYHRVHSLLGRETWTLFLVAPKSRSWAFWVPGRGPVPWRQRLAERGIPVDGGES